jgi:hypothetical protein
METITIRRNAPVVMLGDASGIVRHVIVDPQTREVVSLVIEQNGRKHIAPATAIIGADGDTLALGATWHNDEGAAFDRRRFRAVDARTADRQSQRRSLRGGLPLVEASDDSVSVSPLRAPARAATTGQAPVTWALALPEFREAWETQYQSSGRRWSDLEPAYRYGYEMAHDPQYRASDFATVEADLRAGYREWAARSGYAPAAGEEWEDIREAVQHAWERTRARFIVPEDGQPRHAA